MPPRPAVLGVLGAVVAGVGCEGDLAPGAVTVRDSAGVEIVESYAPAWGDVSPWTVDPVPVLDLALSGRGSEHEFMRVRDVRRLPDGRILVVDEGLDEVRAFGPDGDFVTSIGREGDGPGEFRRPRSVQPYRGDSLVVWDFWLRRITVLAPDLQVVRVESLREPGVRLGQDLYWAGDSTFVGTEYTLDGMDQVLGHYRRPEQISRVVFGSGRRDSIAMVAGYEGFSFERGDARPPFGRSSVVALRGSDIVAGDADRMEFRVHAPTGELNRILRVPGYDLSIDPSEGNAELDALIRADAPPAIRALRDRMAVPDTRPAYASLRVDGLGYLWAARYRIFGRHADAEVWEIFSPDGAWMGSVSTPPRFEVFDIGRDYITGVFRDELDVEHPQVLALER